MSTALPPFRAPGHAPIAFGPTPLHEAERLSEAIGVRVLVKRDDQTGLALGGNKARKLEYLVADARAAGATTLITTGAAATRFCVKTDAATAGLSETINARSSLATLRMPA